MTTEKTPPPVGKVAEVEVTKYPSEVEAFGEVLKRCGVPEDRIPATVDYCSQQDLKDLEKLDANLWDMGLPNVHQRRRIIKYWSRSIGLAIPEELTEKYKEQTAKVKSKEEGKGVYSVKDGKVIIKGEPTFETPEEAVKAVEALEETREKRGPKVRYIYDAEVDKVRMAKEGEIGGTLDEAKELQRLAHTETKEAIKPFDETKFVLTEGGWAIAPGARLTGFEMMTWQMMQKAKERGEPIDPEEAAVAALERAERLKALMGGKGEGGFTEFVDAFDRFDQIIQRRMPPAREGESEAVKTLGSRIETLQSSLETMKEEARKRELEDVKTTFSAQLKEAQDSVDKIRQELRTREEKGIVLSEYGLMDKFLTVADKRLGSIETMLRTTLARGGETRELPGGQIIEGLKAVQTEDAELDKLEDELFFSSER